MLIGITFIFTVVSKNRLKYSSWLILFVYIFWVFCSTIFFRPQSITREYNFTPLWSYHEIQNGLDYLIYDNLYNVILFIPIGFLFHLVSNRINSLHVIVIGFVLSSFIEFNQYLFKRGFSETDDIIHNTLGSVIGSGLYLLIAKGVQYLMSKQ